MSGFSQPNLVSEHINRIRQTVPESVRLIAITKQVPVAAIREAYAAGLRDFGESKVQEATDKQAQLQDLPDITWHFIGHLQSNKAQKAVTQFAWIHSVDNLKLAQRLDRLAESLPHPPNICLQVKILPDPNKHGWTVPDLLADLPTLEQLTHLNICGLMTIPPANLDEAESLKVFQHAHDLADKINQQSDTLQIRELSMGMSGDYPLAIQAGATMIRLGRILFGERPIVNRSL